MNTWTGNIGLVNVSDVLKASTNSACTSVTEQLDQLMDSMISTCNSDYLVDLPDQTGYWTINNAVWESGGSSDRVWYVAQTEGVAGLVGDYADNDYVDGARPVLYLRSNIQFTSGNGTKSQPFLIGE